MATTTHQDFLNLLSLEQETATLLDTTRQVLLTDNHGRGIISLWMDVAPVVEGGASLCCSEEAGRVGNTLKLFATGTWREYVENERRYIHLDDILKRRLKCLTVVTLCEHVTRVDYRVLQGEVDMDSVDDLESLVIHDCIYTGRICGTLDQKHQCLNVSSAVSREVSPDTLDGMVQSLGAWLDQAHRVARFLEEQAYTIGKTVEKSAIRASYQERQLQEASRKVSVEKAKKMAAETEDHLLSLPQKERHGSRLKKTRRQ